MHQIHTTRWDGAKSHPLYLYQYFKPIQIFVAIVSLMIRFITHWSSSAHWVPVTVFVICSSWISTEITLAGKTSLHFDRLVQGFSIHPAPFLARQNRSTYGSKMKKLSHPDFQRSDDLKNCSNVSAFPRHPRFDSSPDFPKHEMKQQDFISGNNQEGTEDRMHHVDLKVELVSNHDRTVHIKRSRPTRQVIHATIASLLGMTDKVKKVDSAANGMETKLQTNPEIPINARCTTMGILGEPMDMGEDTHMVTSITTEDASNTTQSDTTILARGVLVTSTSSPSLFQRFRNRTISVRTSTPSDDLDIARLRLSVFSDLSLRDRHLFCSRSCDILQNRRIRGSTCLVASCSSGLILGTAECSAHEFSNVRLGTCRPKGSILYVTEVAVCPKHRRCGTGTILMKAVDELAMLRGVETIYLHVDVANQVACEMYRKAGYFIANKFDPIYREFTTSLMLHDGATKGRIHHLLFKNLVPSPTWLHAHYGDNESKQFQQGHFLGFDL